jgi:endonuclease/exonuclease/phosphatase (EEP) superfamily protein YafD
VLVALLTFLTALLVAFTFLPMSRAPAWWVRSCDFPRLQFFGMGVLLVVAKLWLLDLGMPESWVLIALVAACVLRQAWWIGPYTFLHEKQVRDAADSGRDHRIRIMIANVLMFNRNAGRLIEIVREAQPDVLVTVETNEWWEEQLAALESDYCYSMKRPQDNRYGMHLYSRLPLSDGHLRYLTHPDYPSMHTRVTLRCGKQIELHCVHPAPPSPTEKETSILRDAELIVLGRLVADAKLPIIVTGDLNDVAWSSTTSLFRKVSGLLDPRIGRGMFNTFHAEHSLLRWPLDHLFHSDDFTLGEIRRLPKFGSDHFPMLIELALEPVRGDDQEEPEAGKEEKARAREKMARLHEHLRNEA